MSMTRAMALLALVVLVASCGGDDGARVGTAPAAPSTAPPTSAPSASVATSVATGAANPSGTASPPTTVRPTTTAAPVRCIVRLHGKGGGGGATTQGGVVVNVNPNGNAPGWNGRQWLYYPEASYEQARQVVADGISAARCTQTVVKGFSNGASFAAKLACRGERFGNTVVGYIVDDPVVDRAVEGCQRPADIKLALYWTGDINIAPGWDCRPSDWTCEGGVSIGIDAYEKALGVTRKKSVHSSHREYSDPPELTSWW